MTDVARPSIAYLGWHKRGNLGDDAIYDAVRSQLPAAKFLDMPITTHQTIRAAATGLNRSLRRSKHLVIGGGTLIGKKYVRRKVNRGLALTRSVGGCAIGVGVEDPVFTGRRTKWDKDDLKRWLPILSQFHTVSARGPRSRELLSDIGLDVKVSGDPALLLPRPDVVPEDGLIGLNLGFGLDLWGDDPKMLVNEVASAVRELSSRGYRFVGVLMTDDDKRWTEAALKDVVADIVRPTDADAAASELARCSVAVVSRLHAGILASLSDTPLISLEYQPKCRDFALSIDSERSLIRTDQVRSGAIVERVSSAVADSANIRANTRVAVTHLRRCLQADYAALKHQLDPDGKWTVFQ
jgi:polysaccharide pyruvyl transferase WcaK-like protein